MIRSLDKGAFLQRGCGDERVKPNPGKEGKKVPGPLPKAISILEAGYRTRLSLEWNHKQRLLGPPPPWQADNRNPRLVEGRERKRFPS